MSIFLIISPMQPNFVFSSLVIGFDNNMNRFLEETNCVGMCINLCKMPSQSFIKDSLGMPVNMVPSQYTHPATNFTSRVFLFVMKISLQDFLLTPIGYNMSFFRLVKEKSNQFTGFMYLFIILIKCHICHKKLKLCGKGWFCYKIFPEVSFFSNSPKKYE